jgi:hypothetical protein
MNKSKTEILEIQVKYVNHINRLDKITLNIYAVSNIRYWYWCLANFRKTPNQYEDIMQMDALTTSIVISYGRLFGKGTGSSILSKSAIPTKLQKVHDDIISLRHGKYAHHGEHNTLQKNIDIQFDGNSFIVTPTINIIFCLGAPKEWEPLFIWLDEHMHELVKQKLDFLTHETGIKWEIPITPAPHWI